MTTVQLIVLWYTGLAMVLVIASAAGGSDSVFYGMLTIVIGTLSYLTASPRLKNVNKKVVLRFIALPLLLLLGLILTEIFHL